MRQSLITPQLDDTAGTRGPVRISFFKQKTAYEIYQCAWSSDVCSSDLFSAALTVSGLPAWTARNNASVSGLRVARLARLQPLTPTNTTTKRRDMATGKFFSFKTFSIDLALTSMLKKLHCTLMFFSRSAGIKCPKVLSLAGLGILLA